MKSRRFYKGDVIQKIISDNLNLEYCWGRDLIGVTKDTNSDAFQLFYRPWRNYIKDFFYQMFN